MNTRLAAGRSYLAIPGPSVMPDRVLRAMHRAAPNIYEGALHDMMSPLLDDLKGLAGGAEECAIYIANGHGAWEAALCNVLAPGDRVLALATGRFGHGWAEIAAGLDARVEMLDFGQRATVDIARLEAALAADPGQGLRAVLLTHVDTASSVRNDVAAVRAALDAADHPALLMVDCIASLGCDRFEMARWGVDVMVAGSQKGLMTPPGLGFVFFNARAKARRGAVGCRSRYWDWRPRTEPARFYEYFGGTAPTHHLYGLREALDMIAEEGRDDVLARHAVLARAIWACFEAWGQGGPAELNIADAALRSHAVTAIRIGADHGARLREWTEKQTGVTLGIGLGMVPPGDPAEGGFFRIGHMGHVNAHMVLGTLAAIQAGFEALGIPYGPGGLDAAAGICAAG
ncbi:alanine-glyoxylate transaminase serine-glyoxylate transaminase serine-pyruvate transaminase [Profundibacterium mesophilum KAUST100406-0324]|uniref:Alanine-glyoxylate transaminase serine-glyoxylate transaminase serine-pyruvate transaminase n=2 Tax=Profundibacterium TaxID=1258570 RepID=A0A921TDF9_9RHOB|nr:alanine-glyoxylate transaminase serine-glyoxylate transaminase serine-pyruvate transaminase [Profundibacterium mesophilum KAUST100406-0324]